ncbi:hypothetical protein CAL29_19055 [Bordetella genomosp. 10]|uniref:Uncharacterized protein n=1 Tax=Bordetella genomosp. 10 TaxID=1416804 RepID=A0A261RZ56_9BORD|nr:hypothetical protein [Bordetella genomosp. 10]OZI30161.1 hypothetical protein CAL29_19055 [Bordetella genomosp. 10]
MPTTARTLSPGAGKQPDYQTRADLVSGTHTLPMPDQQPIVAGMPRRARALTDPGDPGIPRPEDDVYANEASDLSEEP